MTDLVRMLVCSGSCVASCLSFAAHAADATPASGLEEIIVTAQRRAENLQRVPVAVTAITAGSLESAGVPDTQALPTLVPGLNFTKQGDGAKPFIRGVGSQFSLVGIESSVGVYLDDVYLTYGAVQVMDLNNVRSIEVLRGPQGTLFGRNSTGGVIHAHTRDPGEKTTADLGVGYGNFDTRHVTGYVSAPLMSSLSVSLSGFLKDQGDGWGRNVTTGRDTHTHKDYGGNLTALWEPTETTRVRLGFTRTLSDGNEPQLSDWQTVPDRPNINLLLGRPRIGFYDAYGDGTDRVTRNFNVATLRIDQDLGFARIASITGHQKFSGGIVGLDQDFSPDPIIYAHLNSEFKTLTQELQLLSPDDAKINWIGGLYYLHDRAGWDDSTLTIMGSTVGFSSKQTTDSWSAFAQATAPLLDDSNHLTLGIRYTDDERKIRGGIPGLNSGLPADEASWTSTNYRVALDHAFTPDVLGYASYNTGFRSGVYDQFSFVFRAGPFAAVKPEKIKTLELGLKSEWLGNTLRVNVAAFSNDVSNMQTVKTATGGTEIFNAGSAEIHGLELETEWAATLNLTFTAGFSFQDSEYDKFPVGPSIIDGTVTPINADLSGNEVILAPDFTGSIGLAYEVPIATGNLTFNTQYFHSSSFFFTVDNSLQQDNYSLVNASLTWAAPADNFDVRLWGRNLGKQKYAALGDFAAGLGPFYQAAEPRTYGVSFGVHF